MAGCTWVGSEEKCTQWMAAIVAYNAFWLHTDGIRDELRIGLSEFGCDIAIGTATTINVTFAVGAGLIGTVALIVLRTRDLYREVVEPIIEPEVIPKPSVP